MGRVAGVGLLGIAIGAAGRSAFAPPTALDVLEARTIQLVDGQGRVVGHLGATERGAELVLGGSAQVSLVTDGETSAINLVGGRAIVRVYGDSDARIDVWTPDPEDPDEDGPGLRAAVAAGPQ